MPTGSGKTPAGECAGDANIRSYGLGLLRRLEHLKAAAEPAAVAHKDALAHEALETAARLFDSHAGWARDHLVGRLMAGIPSAPYLPGTEREQALGPNRPWDDPTLERKGAAYEFTDRRINQRIGAELAQVCADIFRPRFGYMLSEAFSALLLGEPHELFRPERRRLGSTAARAWRLRLRALQHAEFLHGKEGAPKQTAQMRVANAYGLGEPPNVEGWKTIEKWQSRLPEKLDKFRVHDSLERALRDGQRYRSLSGKSALDEFDRESLRDLTERYGPDRLKEDGLAYRRLVPKSRRGKSHRQPL